MRVEVDKYETAIAWLRDLIYGSEFDKERYVIFFFGLAERFVGGCSF